jgi:transcriptional regulator with GAF, ATPase, and Fis domain
MNEALLKKVEVTENLTQAEPMQAEPAPRATLRAMRDKTEIFAISQALEESGWNRKRAAKLLSISYRGLLYKIRQHNITPSSVSSLTQASRQEM